MTEDDFAIEALAALPGSDHIADDGFSVLIIRKIAQRRRRKNLTLGAVGSIGSALAGAQLTSFVAAMPAVAATNETIAPFLTGFTPEAIVTTGVAGLVAVVAWIVPGRV